MGTKIKCDGRLKLILIYVHQENYRLLIFFFSSFNLKENDLIYIFVKHAILQYDIEEKKK